MTARRNSLATLIKTHRGRQCRVARKDMHYCTTRVSRVNPSLRKARAAQFVRGRTVESLHRAMAKRGALLSLSDVGQGFPE